MTRFRFRLDRWHVLALLFLAVLAWLYTHRLAAWLIDDDEEGYLYAAWRISQGELPYRDFVTPQLPAFLYPGAALIALFGRDPWVPRLWSCGLTLVAGGATYLTGRRLFGPVAGLVALVTAFLIDDIFAIARSFRPESTMLACAAVGLYLLARAETGKEKRGLYAAASLFFGAAILAKLFGALPWAAAVAFVIGDAATGGRPRRQLPGDFLALVLPGLLLVGAVMGSFLALTPETYNDVFLHHVRQGAKLSPQEVVQNALSFYARALHWHASYVALLPAGLFAARRLAPRRWALVAWQLPTLFAFLFLSRQLWARHLVYLLPAVGLLVGAAAAWIDDREPPLVAGRQGSDSRLITWLLIAGIAGVLALPHLLEDWESTGRTEVGTRRIASLVQAFVREGSQVLPDYPGIAFYAGRTTTKHAAGLSEGATESGQITGADLLDEMKRADVEMVLMDTVTQSGQLADMADYDTFAAAVESQFVRLGHFWRFEQPFTVYVKPDRLPAGLDFGWAELLTVRHGHPELAGGLLRAEPSASQAFNGGDPVNLNLVWRVKTRAEHPLTAFVHLVGADGEVWSQGDSLLDNALGRSTEEWEEGEVVATPLALRIAPGTPPGAYTLQTGVYDRETGARVKFTDPKSGATRDAFDVGPVEVGIAERPPVVRPADFGASATTRTLRAGPLRLVALDAPDEAVRAGDEVVVPMTWQAESDPSQSALGLVLTLDTPPSALSATNRSLAPGDKTGRPEPRSGAPIASTHVDLVKLALPGMRWFKRGDFIGMRPRLTVKPDSPPGPAELRAVWMWDHSSPIGHPITLATVQIVSLPPAISLLPSDTQPRQLRFLQGAVRLSGWQGPADLRASAPLTFTLQWQASAPLTATYTVLAHLVDAAGTVVAQADDLPSGGARPTTGWRPGEFIADRHLLHVPDLPGGDYRLLVGLYDAREPGMPRLPAIGEDGTPSPDGRLEIARWTLGGP